MEKPTKRTSKYSGCLPLICRICGDVARGLNFNVITCMSCKIFFHRYAYRRRYMHSCQYNGHCKISKSTRSYCNTCRLEKCFAEGMDPSLIRSIPPYPRVNHRVQKTCTTEQNDFELPMPLTLSLLRNDRSTLNSDQWNLISNLIHIYDEQHCIPQIKSVFDEICSLPLKLRTKPSKISDMINQLHNGVLPLAEHSLDLRSLPIDVRRAAAKHNMYNSGSINALFLFRELDLYNNPAFIDVARGCYTNDIVIEFARNSHACDPNGILIKIFVFILMFSSNCSIVMLDEQEDFRTMSNSIHLVKIQNLYVTTLWKYLLYLYGHEEAVRRFMGLVQRLLNILYIAELILNNAVHSRVIDTIIADTERVLVLND